MNGSMRGLLRMHASRVQKLRSNVKLHRVIGASQNCSFSSFSCNLDKQLFFTAGNNSLPSRDDAVAPCATSSDSSPFRTFSHGRVSGNNNPESLKTTIVTMPSQISDSSRFQAELLSANDHQTESLSLFSPPTNHHQHITNHNKNNNNNNTNKNINNHNNHNNQKHQNNMTVSNTQQQQPKQQQFDQYMQDHKIDSLFNELTTSLIQNQPENPIDFIINELEAKRRAQPYRKVVFVLGGPGSGKGTQCAKMVEQFGFVHFSAGDLLRAESESDSETGKMISNMIREGQIVPGHITIGLLKKAIFSHPDSENTTFLIDGFPREMKQALDFERQVTPCQFVLFFDCPESVLEERLLSRGLTSGRSDDNIVSIRKRFQTYQKQTMPVIDYFAAHDKVKHIITSKPVHEVFNEVRGIFGL